MQPERTKNDEAASSGARPSARSRSGAPAPKASSKLLASAAARLRELEHAANGAASELRGHAIEANQKPSPGGSDRVASAVLYELILTLSERADALEHEAELIAGILERARDAILDPENGRRPRPVSLAGRARLTKGAGEPPEKKTDAVSQRVEAKSRSDGQPKRPAVEQASGARETSEETPGEDEPGRPASAGVKLLAVQMALDGQSRHAIQVWLKEEFGVIDPAPAVREVLEGVVPGS